MSNPYGVAAWAAVALMAACVLGEVRWAELAEAASRLRWNHWAGLAGVALFGGTILTLMIKNDPARRKER